MPVVEPTRQPPASARPPHLEPQQRPGRRAARVLRILHRTSASIASGADVDRHDLNPPQQLHPREPAPVVVVLVHEQRRLRPPPQVPHPRRLGAPLRLLVDGAPHQTRPPPRTSPAAPAAGPRRPGSRAAPRALAPQLSRPAGNGVEAHGPKFAGAFRPPAAPRWSSDGNDQVMIGGAAAGRDRRTRRPLALRPLAAASRGRPRAHRLLRGGHQGEGAVPARDADRDRAEADLRASSETLAAALVETGGVGPPGRRRRSRGAQAGAAPRARPPRQRQSPRRVAAATEPLSRVPDPWRSGSRAEAPPAPAEAHRDRRCPALPAGTRRPAAPRARHPRWSR